MPSRPPESTPHSPIFSPPSGTTKRYAAAKGARQCTRGGVGLTDKIGLHPLNCRPRVQDRQPDETAGGGDEPVVLVGRIRGADGVDEQVPASTVHTAPS